MNQFKLHIRVGRCAFAAEGATDAVNLSYQRFLETLPALGSAAAALEHVNQAHPTESPYASFLAPWTVQFFYAVDGNGGLILKKPATTDATSLLLLLYGFHVCLGQARVSGTALLAAAVASGLKLDRVDRLLEAEEKSVASEGERRGKRYWLTPRGVALIQSLLAKWEAGSPSILLLNPETK